MTATEIRIPASRYEDEDDCLTAAAADYAREHDLAGWDLSPRWADDQRDEIVLTVPAAEISDEQIEALRSEAGAAGDREQGRICDRALDGDQAARAECARVIAAAAAQES